MLNFILPILKNPLTKIVAEKTVGAIQHKLEKDKILKLKKRSCTKRFCGTNQQQENSFKDEWLVIFFTILMACHFLP